MDNEETRLINEDPTRKEQTVYTTPSPATTPKPKKRGSSIGHAAGGFVAGAAAGIGVSATAQTTSSEIPSAIDEVPEASETEEVVSTQETPAPEQAILANDEGIRIAHVDADNFNDAFAQARQQVGPGGVFEYNGRLYGTYYADEWNSMTAQERADYQSRVSEIVPSGQTAAHIPSPSETPVAHEESAETIPTNAEMISPEPVDSEIRVLGVETVQNEDGQIMNVALVECEGNQALFVDVDNNGTIDVLIHEENGINGIQPEEIHDISDAGLEMADLMQAQAAQEGDILYAANDEMPDYVNDADSIMTV
ncbi:MAG: hypothetical protein HDS02_08500 [Bacteroides sp.]|nr:hypothetical protein [Bacteroides sp.]